MRIIHADKITETISKLCQRANFELASDMRQALEAGVEREVKPLAKNTLLRILRNAEAAEERQIAMCQDTGLAVVFARVGQEVCILGASLHDAINEGVRRGYREGYLRASVVNDPLVRENTRDNTPAILHTELVEGDSFCLQLLAKGGGCENMSRFRMLTPAEGRSAVIDFVCETALLAGPNACPPIIVGVGLGGSFEYSAVLAKKSLFREVGKPSDLPHIKELEEEILQRINASGIGPQGYGGATTSLAVHIETAPCHIASLPVSVNIECHAHRHQEARL